MANTGARRVVRPNEQPPFIPSGQDVPFERSPFADDVGAPGPTVADVAPEPAKGKPETEKILDALAVGYVALAKAVELFDPASGVIIAMNANELAESWQNLLDNNPKLRKRFLGYMETSGWATVITAHLAVAVPIALMHRGKLDHIIKPRSHSDATDTAAS